MPSACEQEGDEGDAALDWVEHHHVGERIGRACADLIDIGVGDLGDNMRRLVADLVLGAEVPTLATSDVSICGFFARRNCCYEYLRAIDDAVAESAKIDGSVVEVVARSEGDAHETNVIDDGRGDGGD